MHLLGHLKNSSVQKHNIQNNNSDMSEYLQTHVNLDTVFHLPSNAIYPAV